MNDQKEQIVEKLKAANNILVTVSTNPSVDQLAACIGLTLLLNKMNKHATAVFSGQVPSTIEFLNPGNTIERTTDSLRDFIISLDKAKADKLRYKVEDEVVKIFITPYKSSITEKDLVYSQGDFNVDVVMALGVHQQQDLDSAITAHGRILHDAVVISVNNTPSGQLGSIHLQDLSASGLSEIVASMTPILGENLLDAQISTAFLTGIVAETNHFGNQKTTPQTMTVSAALLAAGANQQLVATKLAQASAPKPPQQAATPNKPAAAPTNDGNLKIAHPNSGSAGNSGTPNSSNSPNTPGSAQQKQGQGNNRKDNQRDGQKGNERPQQQKSNQNQNQNQNAPRPNQNKPTPNPNQNTNPNNGPEKREFLKPAPATAPVNDSDSLDALLKAADEDLAKSISSTPAITQPAASPTPLPAIELTEPETPLQTVTQPSEPVESAAPASQTDLAPAAPLEIIPAASPALTPEIDPKETLTDIEEAVHSPHAEGEADDPTHVDSARKAVEDALKSTADESTEPLAALNAVPVNLDLGHGGPEFADAPSVAPSIPAAPMAMPDIFSAASEVQPVPGNVPAPMAPPPGLPDYLQTPSVAPQNVAPASFAPPVMPSTPVAPTLPLNPAVNEQAPLMMSPADQPFTMPLPPNSNVAPPQVIPSASTGLPPQGPPPPPVPPPMMPFSQ